MRDEVGWFTAHRWPIDALQIDEGWERTFGDWETREPWGDVTVEAFSAPIADLGYQPGIWTCPLIADVDAELVAQHPDWMLRHSSGERLVFPMMGREHYVLDPTHPEVDIWIADLFRRLTVDWGYTYHKVDFTRAVILSKDAVFHDPTATRAEACRRGVAAMRRGAGDEAYLLICGGAYLPSIGLADGQRSGSDVKSRWEEPRADLRIRQNLLRYWMNRLWHQDPDSLMVRRRETPFRDASRGLSLGLFSDEEARTLVVNQYLGGGLICFTERMSELDADRAALYRHIVPSLGIASEPADLFGNGRIPAVHVTHVQPRAQDLAPWHTIAVINFDDRPHEFGLTLDRDLLLHEDLDADARYLVWEFFGARLVGVFRWGAALPPLLVPPHGTRLLRVSAWDGASPHLLATDRHLSMGGVEIGAWQREGDRVVVDIRSDWSDPFRIWIAQPDGGRASGLRTVAYGVADGDALSIPAATRER
jgi:alpha-galactosidase